MKKVGIANQVWPQRSGKAFFKSDTKHAEFPSWGNLPIWTPVWALTIFEGGVFSRPLPKAGRELQTEIHG